MLTSNDRKVAALLLNEGHLTREQINECVGIKERLEEPRSLASILVARRYVTYDRLKGIMANAIQRVQSREYSVAGLAAAPSAPSAPVSAPLPSRPLPPSVTPSNNEQARSEAQSQWNADKELASLLVARHIVTEAQARECLGLLMQVLKAKPNARLTQVILKRRYASRDALRHVLKEYEMMRSRRRGSDGGSGPISMSQTPNATRQQQYPAPSPPPPPSPAFSPPPPSPQSGAFQTMPESSPFASTPGTINSSNYASAEFAPPPSGQAMAPLPGFDNGQSNGSDPFASVKPTRPPLGSGFDSKAPLRFGSGANYAAVGQPSSADNSRTVNLQVPSASDIRSASQAQIPAFGNSVDMGSIVNGLGNSGESLPIGLDAADSEMTMGMQPRFNASPAGLAPNPLQQGSNAMFAPPQNGFNNSNAFNNQASGEAPMFGGQASGESPNLNGFSNPSGPVPAFTANSGPDPFSSNFGSPPNMPPPQAFNAGSGAFPVGGAPATTPMGFQTMDLDDSEVTMGPSAGNPMAPQAFASGPVNSPFASGPTPSPFASGPTPAPAPFSSGPSPAPGAFASGPVPSPFASGPVPMSGPDPFASGPVPMSGPDPFASGPAPMSAGPMGSAAVAPAGFRTFDLDTNGGSQASGPVKRRATQVEQSSAATHKAKKKKKKNSASKSRVSAERRSRADVAAELQGRSFQTTEILIAIACILVVIGLGYGIVRYYSNSQKYQELKQNYQNAYNLGKNSEAYELVQQLLEYDPDNSALQDASDELKEKVEAEQRRSKAVQLIEAAKIAESPEAAVKLCEEAIKTDSTFATAFVELGRAHYRSAHADRRNGDMAKFREHMSEADENFREAIIHKNDNQVAHFYLAEVVRERAKLIERSTLVDLKSSYSRGVTADKQSFYGMMCDVRLRELRGLRDEALKFVNQAIDKDNSKPIALLTRARIHMHRRDYPSALKDLKRVLEIDKGSPDALFLRAHVYYWQEEFQLGLDSVKEAFKLDKGSSYGMALEAYGLWKLDTVTNKQAAIDKCKKAIAFDDRHYYPYRVYGEIVLGSEGEKQDLNLAGRMLQLATARAKYVAQNYYLYGKTLQFSSDNSGADKNYAVCLRYDKKHPQALANRGAVLRSLKKYPEALDHLNRAVKLLRHDSRVIFNRSKVKWEQLTSQRRNSKQAIKWSSPPWDSVMSDLDESIRLNNTIADVWGRRAYLKQQRVWDSLSNETPANRLKEFKKQARSALNDYDKAIELDKANKSTYWNGVRCLLYRKLGRYADAIEDGEAFLRDEKRKVGEENVRVKVDRAIKFCKAEIEKRESE